MNVLQELELQKQAKPYIIKVLKKRKQVSPEKLVILVNKLLPNTFPDYIIIRSAWSLLGNGLAEFSDGNQIKLIK